MVEYWKAGTVKGEEMPDHWGWSGMLFLKKHVY